jgi:hypothetical protein
LRAGGLHVYNGAPLMLIRVLTGITFTVLPFPCRPYHSLDVSMYAGHASAFGIHRPTYTPQEDHIFADEHVLDAKQTRIPQMSAFVVLRLPQRSPSCNLSMRSRFLNDASRSTIEDIPSSKTDLRAVSIAQHRSGTYSISAKSLSNLERSKSGPKGFFHHRTRAPVGPPHNKPHHCYPWQPPNKAIGFTRVYMGNFLFVICH